MYKIIASDLDGTLLDNTLKISEENTQAINELINSGVCFVPSSGRCVSEMPKELVNNPGIRYIIQSNGASVYDKLAQNDIYMCISNKLSLQIIDIIKGYDVHITVRHNGKSYVDINCQSDECHSYYNLSFNHHEVINTFALYTKDFDEFIRGLDNVEMFSVFFHSHSEMEECRKLLEQTGELLIAEAFHCNLEIFSHTAGKGNALRRLADSLGVEIADTIAVGDSLNDMTMIQAAGLGLAVSNACKPLKETADKVICSNEEHAIAYIKKTLF